MLAPWKRPITILSAMGEGGTKKFNIKNVNIFNYSMPSGTELDITGCVYDDADQIRFDLQCHPNIKLRVKVEKFRVIAMHINPR